MPPAPPPPAAYAAKVGARPPDPPPPLAQILKLVVAAGMVQLDVTLTVVVEIPFVTY